jgi:transposase
VYGAPRVTFCWSGRWRIDRLGLFLRERAGARVVLETCTEAFRVAAAALAAGHEVRVVAATLVRSLGVGQRGLKTDVRDARVLSEASCRMDLPSVHVPTAIAQEVKALCVSREALIEARTQLIGRVRGYVRSRLGRVLRATPESLPKRVRAVLLADPDGLPAHVERLLIVLETISGQIADADEELRLLAEADVWA